MTLRFILGRAGSGKTRFCLEAMIGEEREAPLGPPLIFLVPEQATFQMEKELLQLSRGATCRIQVLSFQRLAFSFKRQGEELLLKTLTETGRQMILRRLLQQRSAGLKAFGRSARHHRFCEKLSEQMREFKNCLVTPEALTMASCNESLSVPTRAKLADLALIFTDYLDFIKGEFSDPEDSLSLLASALETDGLPPGTKVWVDGFAGFTPQEYMVIAGLLKTAHHLEIALCLDPDSVTDNPQENELFYPTLDTYRRLRQISGRTKTAALTPLALPLKGRATRFGTSPGLAYLESKLFDFTHTKPFKPSVNLRLVSASNRRAEVEAVARDMLNNARTHGWRFRQMALVLRDLDIYHDLVSAVFSRSGIPFFIDHRRALTHHPLVELVRSALNAACANLRQEDVFHMLKTDLFDLTRSAVDKLENYVLAHGINGSHWFAADPWTWRLDLALDREGNEDNKNQHDLTEINQSKDNFLLAFTPFYREVSAQWRQTASFYCRALWQLIIDLDVCTTLQQWSETESKLGNLEMAASHRLVWKDVVGLLAQIDEILGDTELTLKEFSEVLQAGLEGIRSGLVPAAIDQVVVGSVERSRHSELRAVYVLGLCDGEFPARLGEDGMFSDSERSNLAVSGTELAITRRQRLFNEQYLAYIALTRPSEYLFASYPLAGDDGKAKRPSPVFNRLCKLFPENRVEFMGITPAAGQEKDYLAGGKNIAAALLLNTGTSRKDEFWSAVQTEAVQVPAIYEHMKIIWPALSYSNHSGSLNAETVASLYELPLSASVSRLELYAKCPFSHYARYGLRLRERREYGIEAPDMGNFYHAALRLFTEELLAAGIDWGGLGEAEAAVRMSHIVDRLIPRLHGEMLLSSGRLRYLASLLKENLTRAAVLLTIHAARSGFAAIQVELPFIMDNSEEGIVLAGRIDRIDTAVGENGIRYVRVIDYKSRATWLKLADVWHGLSLQLIAYLDAALKMSAQDSDKIYRPAGAFYFSVDKPYTRVNNPPREDTVTDKSLRLEGLVLAEQEVLQLMGGSLLVPASLNKDGSFRKTSHVATEPQLDALRQHVAAKLSTMGGAVLSGDTAIYPYLKESGEKACKFCNFSPLCRFDTGAGGNRYRLLRNYSRQEILDNLFRNGGEE